MCVILYAPPKKKISEEHLRNAFYNNIDGAGVMFYDWDGKVNYKKGFMTFKELKSFWDSLDDRLARAVHCRIATSGQINAENCHPFKISRDMKEMQQTEGIANAGCFMHNGILKDYTPKEGLKSPYSDSMVFGKQVLFPIVKAGCIKNDGVRNLIDALDNVFLLFMPNNNIIMFGDWVKDADGFYASNKSYTYPPPLAIDYGGETYYSDEFDSDYAFIQDIYPRYEYKIMVRSDDGEIPYHLVDDLVDDLNDFLISLEQPYYTLINKGNNLYTLEMNTYEDIDLFLNSNYVIVDKVTHTN